MSEQRTEYRIAFRRSYPELEDEINALAVEGYEVVSYSPGSQDVYPSAVMRLRLDELMPRLDELTANAQQIRNDQRDLLAKIQALAADNIDLHRTKAHVDDLTALESRVNRTQETLARGDARLAEVAERVKALEEQETRTFIDHLECRAKALELALQRYQDTHAETHTYLDARKVLSQDVVTRLAEAERRIESVDSTMADAVLARLTELERRLDDLQETAGKEQLQSYRERVARLEKRATDVEDRVNGSNELRLLDLDSRVKALEASGACGGVWRKSNAD